MFKVRGIIPAGNFLRVPRSANQLLGCTGRFLYLQVRGAMRGAPCEPCEGRPAILCPSAGGAEFLQWLLLVGLELVALTSCVSAPGRALLAARCVCVQLKASPVKVFVLHIEVQSADKNVHRISISNMYSPDALKVSMSAGTCTTHHASLRALVTALPHTHTHTHAGLVCDKQLGQRVPTVRCIRCINQAQTGPAARKCSRSLHASACTCLQRKSNGIQIPYPRASHRWSYVAVDLQVLQPRMNACMLPWCKKHP